APLAPILLEPVALWLDGLAGRARRWALVACVALGLAGAGVQALGALFAPSEVPRLLTMVRDQTGAPSWFAESPSEAHFIPQFSPIGGHAWMARHAFGRDRDGAADAPWRQLVPNTPKLDGEWPKLRADFLLASAPRSTAAPLLAACVAAFALAAIALAWSV